MDSIIKAYYSRSNTITVDNQSAEIWLPGNKDPSQKSSVSGSTESGHTDQGKNTYKQSVQKYDGSTMMEDLYFISPSEQILDDTEFGPPLDESDLKYMPEEEEELLSKIAKRGDDSIDSPKQPKLLSVFGLSTPKRNKNRSKNRGATTDSSKKWSNCQVPYTIGKQVPYIIKYYDKST